MNEFISLLFALCLSLFILSRMLWHGAIVFIAAFFAGVINSIAGGGMLLVFPVMIWLGVDPKIANATCTVALWPGLFEIGRASCRERVEVAVGGVRFKQKTAYEIFT